MRLHEVSVTVTLQYLGRVLGNYPKNNCGTHFGFSYLIVSKVANLILVVMSHITYIIQLQTCQVCVTQVWCENASLGWVGACRLLYESEQIRRDCTAKSNQLPEPVKSYLDLNCAKDVENVYWVLNTGRLFSLVEL